MPGGMKGFGGHFRGGDGRLQRVGIHCQDSGRTGTKFMIYSHKTPYFLLRRVIFDVLRVFWASFATAARALA